MRKVGLIFIVAMAATVFAGGKQEGQTVTGQKEMAEETYAMVVFLKGAEFFNWAYVGMKDAARAIGPHVSVELQGPAEWDVTLEARAIDSLVARKIDGIAVTAGDATTLIPSINKAIAAKVPVITFDADAPESDRLAFVGTDNYVAGFEAGKAMAEWFKTGHIGVSTFPGPDHLKKRLDGFKAAIEQYGEDIKVSVVNDEGDVVKAETQLTALIQANPDVNGIFAIHGNPGAGAAAAVRSLGLIGRVDIMAFDFGMPVIELIESGEIRGTVGQDPYLMGYMAMILAYSANHPTELPARNPNFGHVPSSVDTGVAILNKDDVQIYNTSPKF